MTKIPMDWSPDGRFLLYQEVDPQTGWDLWALPMSGDRTRIAIANTSFEERGGQFSPDGRWVAYQSNVTGPFEIYVQPFQGPVGRGKSPRREERTRGGVQTAVSCFSSRRMPS